MLGSESAGGFSILQKMCKISFLNLGMKSNFKMQLIPLSFNVYSASNIENY